MYIVFGGQRYYAAGGAFDLLLTSIDKDRALAFAKEIIGKDIVREGYQGWESLDEIEWTHVLDSTAGEMVAEFGERPFGRGGMIEKTKEHDPL